MRLPVRASREPVRDARRVRALRRLCLCTVTAWHRLASFSAGMVGLRVAAVAVFASEMGEALKPSCVRDLRLLAVRALRPACSRRHGRAGVDAEAG